jgi:hypothetical protein
MLTIRSSQVAVLVDARSAALTEAIEAYLRLHHAEALDGLDDALLTRRVGVGLRRARRWGFDSMFGLGLFVALMFEVAPDFDADPQINALLSDPSRPLNDRLDALESTVTDARWQQLAADADAGAWED